MTELRAARRERVLEAMAAAALDVLVLGRRDSVAYATGACSLWTAGTRPFGPACVLVAAHRSTYLLATWDEGVPPEVPFEHLYGITWNPATMAASLGKIPGLAEARRIGVDALSPGFAKAARRLAPRADLVAADDLLHAVRAEKLAGEIAHIRAAVATASASVEAATAALLAGASSAEARAAAVRAAATHGATVPSSGVVVRKPLVGGATDPDAELVHVDVGLLVDGYEGGLGRTVELDPGREDRRDLQHGAGTAVAAGQQKLVNACRPGATPSELRTAAAGADRWMVRGSGMGFEPPVVTADVGGTSETCVIGGGMVLSVEVELQGWHRRDLVLVGADATEVL